MLYLLISITLLAAMSPGPDFFIVMKNALKSKFSGYATSLGVAWAILIHVGYCIAGVGLIISQSILLFQFIKILGALYLLYLSYGLLKAKRSEELPELTWDPLKERNQSLFQSFKEGFLTNAFNPKATIFFLSVFTQVISPETSILTQLFYGIIMATTVGVWFSLLTSLVSIKHIKRNIERWEFYIHKIFWVVLGFLGLKILFSSR